MGTAGSSTKNQNRSLKQHKVKASAAIQNNGGQGPSEFGTPPKDDIDRSERKRNNKKSKAYQGSNNF